MLALAELITAS